MDLHKNFLSETIRNPIRIFLDEYIFDMLFPDIINNA